jgi:hypothetical protein
VGIQVKSVVFCAFLITAIAGVSQDSAESSRPQESTGPGLIAWSYYQIPVPIDPAIAPSQMNEPENEHGSGFYQNATPLTEGQIRTVVGQIVRQNGQKLLATDAEAWQFDDPAFETYAVGSTVELTGVWESTARKLSVTAARQLF